MKREPLAHQTPRNQLEPGSAAVGDTWTSLFRSWRDLFETWCPKGATDLESDETRIKTAEFAVLGATLRANDGPVAAGTHVRGVR